MLACGSPLPRPSCKLEGKKNIFRCQLRTLKSIYKDFCPLDQNQGNKNEKARVSLITQPACSVLNEAGDAPAFIYSSAVSRATRQLKPASPLTVLRLRTGSSLLQLKACLNTTFTKMIQEALLF